MLKSRFPLGRIHSSDSTTRLDIRFFVRKDKTIDTEFLNRQIRIIDESSIQYSEYGYHLAVYMIKSVYGFIYAQARMQKDNIHFITEDTLTV